MSIFPLPPSSNRYWRVWRGRAVMSDEARSYKATLAMLAKCDGVTPLDGPIAVTVSLFRARKSGDLDNRLKVLFDAMQGVFFKDDNQIREIHAYLADDKHNPRVEIEIKQAQ